MWPRIDKVFYSVLLDDSIGSFSWIFLTLAYLSIFRASKVIIQNRIHIPFLLTDVPPKGVVIDNAFDLHSLAHRPHLMQSILL